MKYAVINLSGTQFQVAEDQVISTTNLELEEKENGSTDQVLLFVDEDKVTVGNPFVKNAKVEYQIVKKYQGEKIKVFKYKAKSRYRKTQGFRPQLVDLKITKISL